MASLWQKVRFLVKQAVTRKHDPGPVSLPDHRGQTQKPVAPVESTALQTRLEQFEEKYGVDSEIFYQQYRAGLFAEEGDFVEWAQTVARLKGERL